MSEWTPPTPQQYRGPADPRDGFAAAARAIGDLGRRTRDGLNHLLQAAGIRVEPGKLIIEGDLEVPNGKIKNEWLEHDVTVTSASDDASAFSIGSAGGWVELATCTLVVPEGYSTASINAAGHLILKNTHGSTNAFALRVLMQINGTGPTYGSPAITGWAAAGEVVGWATVFAAAFPVTVDDSLRFSLQAQVGTAVTADAGNYARVVAPVIFVR